MQEGRECNAFVILILLPSGKISSLLYGDNALLIVNSR